MFLAALNYPDHRGTATAFPLSAFGLSAFIFSVVSRFAFPDDTSKFLSMLAIGTFSLVVVSFFFLRVVPHSTYSALPVHEPRERSDSNQLHRTMSMESEHGRVSEEIGAHSNTIVGSKGSEDDVKESARASVAPEVPKLDTDETSSLISKSSSSGPGDVPFHDHSIKSDEHHDSTHLDIRGLSLLPKTEFWQLWTLMGLLTGVGLMTIK